MNSVNQYAKSTEIFWFVARGDTLKGPYTSEQLVAAIHNSSITHSDFCWRQGFKEWRPISSVPDFERRERVQSLPTYPSIPPPVNESFHRDLATIGQTPTPPRLAKHIKVSFARSPRAAISIYEWGLATLFALAFAYFASSFALNEVKRGIEARLELAMLGRSQLIGAAHLPTSPVVWEPLYSAPSLTDVADYAHIPTSLYTDAPTLDFSMPVLLTVQPQHLPDGENKNGRAPATVGSHPKVLLGGLSLVNPASVRLWNPGDFELDPVYSRPVQVRGYLSAHDGTTLEVRQLGEPLR